MAQQSFTLMVQDDQGKSHFNNELLSIIKDILRSEELIPILKNADNFNVSDSSGNTLLHFAAEYNNGIAVHHLIQSGSKIDVQNHLGKTPLIVAIEYQSLSIDILLDANANIFISDNTGKNALHWFHEIEGFRLPHLVWKLFEKVEEDCLYNSKTVASTLFDAGWPLPCVILFENLEILKTMLELGCEVNAGEPIYNRTALHEAVLLSNVEYIKLLLDHGSDVNQMDTFHRTPLHYVYDQGKMHTNDRLEIVKLLINKGALLYTSAEDSSWSQVDLALKYGNGEVIEILLQNNLDLTRKHENDDNTPAHLIATNRNRDAFKPLDNRNFEVDARNSYSETPLWIAAAYGNACAIEFLLERGADVNAINDDYYSPLHACIDQFSERYENRRKECIQCLLEYGADMEQKVPTFVVAALPTVFDVVEYSEIYCLGELLIAHAVLREVLGAPLANFIYRQIESHVPFRTYYEFCQQQLTIELHKSVTLLDLLVMSDRKFERYARDEQSFLSIEHFSLKWKTKLYYFNAILRKRYFKAVRMLKLRKEAISLICKIIKTGYCQYPSIVDQIIGYLSERDLQNFLQLSF